MTAEEFAVIMRRWVERMQLPAALSRLAQILSRSKDAEAAHASQQALSSVRAAESDNTRLLQVLDAAALYFQTVEGAVHFGFVTMTFVGDAQEEQSATVTGQSWANSPTSTPVIPFYLNGPFSSDIGAYNFNFLVDTFVVGTGFKITATTPSAVVAGDYDFLWVGLNS